MESFKAAAAAYDSKNMDPVLKYCAVGRQLGYAMYLTLDTVTYVGIHPCRYRDVQRIWMSRMERSDLWWYTQ